MTKGFFGYYGSENDGYGGYYDESDITDFQAQLRTEIEYHEQRIEKLQKAIDEICSTMLKCEVDHILDEALED